MSNYFTDMHQTQRTNDKRRALAVVMASVALRITPRLQAHEDSASLGWISAVFAIASRLIENPTHEQAKVTIESLARGRFAEDRQKLRTLPTLVDVSIATHGASGCRTERDYQRLSDARSRLWTLVQDACFDLDMIEILADKAYSYAIAISDEVVFSDDEYERFAYSY